MVEYSINLDHIFYSLADPTRRDILKRVTKKELSINEVAQSYDMSLAAVSKHIQVLEKAQLVQKHRKGTYQFIALSPPALKEASKYLKQYQKVWEERFNRLDMVLKKELKKHGKK